MTKEVSDSSELPSGGFTVRAELPWSRETIVVLTYIELLDVFREFGNRRYDQIHFQIEKTPHSLIDEPEVVEQIGWCNKEAGMFDFTVDSDGEDTEFDDAHFEEGIESDGDTGKGVNNGVGVGLEGMEDEGVQTSEGVNNGVGIGLDGMEDEDVQTGEGVENGEDVHVGEGLDGDGQIFGSKEKMRDIFREYANREGVTLGRDKNDNIGEVDPKAKKWLMKIDPHCQSRFGYDQYIRCDHMTNNMTEAFNNMLGTHRAQTYLQLLEFIRRMVMRKLQERKEECEDWRDVLPLRVNARILKNSQASRQLTTISAGDQEYELLGPDGTFPVKLKEYYYGCGSWQISGIPCPHAMAAISHNCGKRSLKDWVPNFVHQSLSKSAYIQTYRGMIHPLPDQNMWPTIETDELLPPPYAKQPSKPKL
ncbi:hypothetical protein Ddye_004968 [Dipteronia dyeriana]|uniref:Zinc finger PMZ-type domain-containing protein n=1 Tax=Dipteronia dyeriana TaxID=168575 RepID=A0AAE0CP66_9ROSI|nr:hypothetical protein Ddye_004968 [Dipteronia dyeriana]